MQTENTKMNKHDKEHILTGEVVSTKMKDTIVVRISRYKKVPKYGKYVTRSERFKVHDPGNTATLGDMVYIKETRPISKDKHFILVGKKAAAKTAEEATVVDQEV